MCRQQQQWRAFAGVCGVCCGYFDALDDYSAEMAYALRSTLATASATRRIFTSGAL